MTLHAEIAGRPRRFGWKRARAVLPPPIAFRDGPEEGGVDEGFIPEAEDQGDLGQCVGESINEIVMGCEKLPRGEQRRFSSLFPYWVGRKLEGTAPTDDAGMQVSTAFHVLDQFGIPFKATWDDDRPFWLEPPPEVYAEAAKHRSLLHLPLPNVATMKSCLDAGFPFAFGVDVSRQLLGERAAQEGRVPFVDSDADWVGGGHAMTAWRYSDKIQIGKSVGGFLVLNHWSTSWGLNGLCWIAYDYWLSGHATDAHSARRVKL